MQAPIVIIGGGFGGLYTALELAKQANHPPLLLVEPNERFVFSPFLYELLSAELALWQLAPRYDNLLAGHGIGWLKDRATAITPETSKLHTVGGKELNYSRLVVATGAAPFSFGVPGVDTYAQTFRTLADVDRLAALIKKIKQQPQPLQRIAVVGAGLQIGRFIKGLCCGGTARAGSAMFSQCQGFQSPAGATGAATLRRALALQL